MILFDFNAVKIVVEHVTTLREVIDGRLYLGVVVLHSSDLPAGVIRPSEHAFDVGLHRTKLILELHYNPCKSKLNSLKSRKTSSNDRNLCKSNLTVT